jgi:hypothetical protein
MLIIVENSRKVKAGRALRSHPANLAVFRCGTIVRVFQLSSATAFDAFGAALLLASSF